MHTVTRMDLDIIMMTEMAKYECLIPFSEIPNTHTKKLQRKGRVNEAGVSVSGFGIST